MNTVPHMGEKNICDSMPDALGQCTSINPQYENELKATVA